MKPRKDKPAVVDSTSSLALMTGRKNYQVEVRDIGVFEWLPTGTANGTDVFAGSSGYWSKIIQSGSGSSYSPLAFVDVSASRDLSSSDVGKMILASSASPIVLTIPTAEDGGFNVGDEIFVTEMGVGQVSFDVSVGVETRSKDGFVAISGQYTGCSLVMNEVDVWLIIGDLSA